MKPVNIDLAPLPKNMSRYICSNCGSAVDPTDKNGCGTCGSMSSKTFVFFARALSQLLNQLYVTVYDKQ